MTNTHVIMRRRWQLCCVPGGSLHVKRVAGFSEIRMLLQFFLLTDNRTH